MGIGMILAVLFLSLALGLAYVAYHLREANVKLTVAHEHALEEMQRLQSSQSQVIHTTKLASLGQMVAGVAHEINTPLGFLKSNVEVVGDLLDDYRKLVQQYDVAVQYCQQPVDLMFGADKASLEKLVKHVEEARRKLYEARATLEKSTLLNEAKELLGDASEGLAQLASLVQNLKSFSRLDRDGLDLMDVNEGIESTLAIAAHLLRDRIQVIKRLGPLPKIRCMPSQINQVFLNLITNAAQAIENDGTLTIESRETAGHVEVSFADTGVGMTEEVLPKIFDPFFTTKTVGEGTGLGLSIVHKIVKGHGGSIKVRTLPGTGSVFTISLPIEMAVSADTTKALLSA